MFSIGIDIGKQGAIVIKKPGDQDIYTKMPMIKSELDYQALYQLLTPYEGGRGMIVFEKLGVIFGTSKSTAFSMGHQAGAVEMACVALSIPFTKVPPKVWQKEMFLGVEEISKPSSSGKTTVRDTKAMALLAAKRLFPTTKLTLGDRSEKPHDGLIDALLMCEYARRIYKT
jgi:hypothetical protein